MSAVSSSQGIPHLPQLTESIALLTRQSGNSRWTVQVLVCTDLWKDQKVLHAAYCDSQGVTEAFIKNGMANAVAAASCGAIRMDEAKWVYDVIVNAEDQQVGRHVSKIAGAMTILHGESLP